MPELGLIGPTYQSRSLNFDAQRTINLFPEVNETKRGKAVAALLGTPGLRRLLTLPGSGGLRGNGLYTASTGRCFAVQGAAVFEVSSTATSTRLGSLLTTTGPVCLADNGLQLVVVDGAYGYVLDLTTNVWTQITSPNFYGADRVQFLDQYLLLNRAGTQQFFWTSLSGVSFDALDFASAEGAPDLLLSLLITHREIWLFGATSTEVWFDSGDLDTPFQRIQGAFVECGIEAPHSVTKFPATHYWLGSDERGAGTAYEAQGYQPVRISTYAVEQAWSSYATRADALGWGELREGHAFWWLTFPTGNATWCYDIGTQLWHERSYLNPSTGTFDRHRANAHTYAFGKHLVGDWENGKIYELDLATYTDDGAPLKWLRRAPYVAADTLPWVFHHTLQVDLETGVGLDAGVTPGSDPQVMLRWSDDNGGTWSNERWTSAGPMGQRRVRALWRRLGRARARVYEISGSDPVKRALLAAYLESEVATA